TGFRALCLATASVTGLVSDDCSNSIGSRGGVFIPAVLAVPRLKENATALPIRSDFIDASPTLSVASCTCVRHQLAFHKRGNSHMNILKNAALVATAVVATAGLSAPAAAQATRTWVSGVGDDANPCSRTAPCKTFAGAISKTAPGGEINVLDPGGFGALTITKAISIICDYTEGGVLVSGSNGFIINAGASDTIYLSGLDFHGAGTG